MRIGFLLNHYDSHQVPHLVPFAFKLSELYPDIEVVILSSTLEQKDFAKDIAAVVAQLTEQINAMFMPPQPQPDPLVELRGKELDIKADDVQRKREEFAQRQEFDAMKSMENTNLAEQRLAIQREIATMKDDIARERMDQAAQFKAMDIMRG